MIEHKETIISIAEQVTAEAAKAGDKEQQEYAKHAILEAVAKLVFPLHHTVLRLAGHWEADPKL